MGWRWIYVYDFGSMLNVLFFSDRVSHQVWSLPVQLVYLTSEPLVLPFPPPHAGVVNMRCDTWVLGMWTLVLLFTHQVISPNPSHGSLSAKTFKHPWRLSIFLHLCFYDDTTAISCLIHCFPNWDPVAFILQSQWSKNLNLEQGSGGDTHL